MHLSNKKVKIYFTTLPVTYRYKNILIGLPNFSFTTVKTRNKGSMKDTYTEL